MRAHGLRRQVRACQSLVTLGHDGYGIPAVHALHLADVVARWGVPREALLRGVVTEARLRDPAAQVSVAETETLVARARALTAEPALGFHLGLQMRVSAHGYLGFAAMVASTVGEALALAARYAPTRTAALSLRVETQGETASVVIEERADFGTARDVVLIALTVGLWQIGTALTGEPLTGRAEFAFAPPGYFHGQTPGIPPVTFGHAQNRLVFARGVLDLRLTQSDPVALDLARAQCERALDALGEAGWVNRVRDAIPHGDRGFRSLEEVAARLGTSPRTLKRKLAEQHVVFSTLLDAQRLDRALRLLATDDLSLDQVAEKLGYSDPANFGRAFRRWTGETPAARRRALLRPGR